MILITLEHILTQIYFSFILVITLVFGGTLVYPVNKLSNSVKKGIIFPFFCITLNLIIRWFYSRHLPLSNLYESLMFFSWNFCLIPFFIDIKNPNTQWIGVITAPSALFTHAFATLILPIEMQQSQRLIPALQSHWLIMHVTIIFLGYVTLLCGSLSSIALLAINLEKKLSFFTLYFRKEYSYENKRKAFHPYSFKNFRKSQMIHQIDNLSYYTIVIGFTFLTIGILSGAVWANEAWGSYWSWDPKEIWALITWLIFANYIHIRLNKGWEGNKPALVASLGLFFVWICYFGVNILGIGFHSYGWFL
uniref:Cytochrome c biogenesis protein CcsA n=2 Tax=Welwitschia mirabilis TaxID=3377 RepID=CCSA_WELMI|nr:cytochrome c biogenesis protein [Welwitschia mirabilis]B2Y206.1 RecName: Full=Cytochrome c biogenesis protein CcsA [Welwitschia mirabilis]ABY26836.1 cytochrome c heme attachment protein [Welwitschia mirabilis]AMA21035.1 cytochrome c heme attachment protein [Welwitschia mirabilis]BAH11182.1 cytochrome c biogenesis protein [Welwitschia mirabilis]